MINAYSSGSAAVDLKSLGWDAFFENHFQASTEQGLYAARVFLEHKNTYRLYSEFGEIPAEIAGKLRYEAKSAEDLPAVGDWVAIKYLEKETKAVMHSILPRKSKFRRKAPGDTTDMQILASNIDTAFLVSGLDRDFNIRRLERYLTLAWDSGACPVVLLNKTDVCQDIEEKIIAVESIAVGVPILAMSAEQDEDFSPLSAFLGPGQTAVLLGSSGVGKSTIINRLLGENVQTIQEVRESDSRGRHTTTHRELFLLAKGGMIIDTPGLRELQLWDSSEGLHEAFDDIEDLAQYCRFRDCRHQNEPSCEVTKAVAEGKLPQERYENYQKLQKELTYLDRMQDQRAALDEKRRWKVLTKAYHKMNQENK